MLKNSVVGAERAKQAGFDGIEVTAPTATCSTKPIRTGRTVVPTPMAAPSRTVHVSCLEVTEAAVSVWGKNRVGVRRGPKPPWVSMSDWNLEATFGYAADQLNKFDLAYLHTIQPTTSSAVKLRSKASLPSQRPRSARSTTAASLPPAASNAKVPRRSSSVGEVDFVAFGRHFSANPDLAYRRKNNLPLNKYDRDSFWVATAADIQTFSTPRKGSGRSLTAQRCNALFVL